MSHLRRSAGILLAVCLALVVSLLGAAKPALADPLLTLSLNSGSCDSASIHIDNPTSLENYFYIAVLAFDSSGNVSQVGSSFGTIVHQAGDFRAGFQPRMVGTLFVVVVNSSLGGFNSPFFYQNFFFYTCSGPGGLPDNRVMASFANETPLYSAPDLKSLIAGKSIHAGQTWFVFGVSADKKFYHVFISDGTSAWVKASDAKLLGSMPSSLALPTSADDNGPAVSTVNTSTTSSNQQAAVSTCKSQTVKVNGVPTVISCHS